MASNEKRVKITVVGDGGTGKTCLLIAYKDKKFKKDYIPTVFDEYSMNIDINNITYKLILSDTAGQEEYDTLRTFGYRYTNIFLVCFSIVDFTSFSNVLNKWIPEVKHFRPEATIILVGTKSDLRSIRKSVQSLEGETLRSKVKADAYMECSAMHLHNVDKVFETALINFVEKNNTTPQRKRNCSVL